MPSDGTPAALVVTPVPSNAAVPEYIVPDMVWLGIVAAITQVSVSPAPAACSVCVPPLAATTVSVEMPVVPEFSVTDRPSVLLFVSVIVFELIAPEVPPFVFAVYIILNPDPDQDQLCERLIVPPPPIPAEQVQTSVSPGTQDIGPQEPPELPRLTTELPFFVTDKALPLHEPDKDTLALSIFAVQVPVPEPAFSRMTFQFP